ncbi:MAG: metal ABC transporter solute-binding protein, Zn/Mn family [Sphaerochaeta sp.]|uniref:metal ABC transporter solute-binding protein, Zn/Mn family n=1 Tax=Sphaerochaeta sp. TaxID=1972642 RepID=UPI00262C8D21|nr:zinc ABC transporter substrate-binding protein [uncultured Sphaerochaeta sp.]
MRTRILVVFLALSSALVFGSGAKETTNIRSKPVVVVSILPHAYFVDQLAHDLVDVVTLVGEGQNPHSYEPSPSQMARLAEAELWILSGTDFEFALRDKVTGLYPGLRIVDGTEGMQFRLLEEHEHEEEGHDEHDMNIDRHTWLGYDQSKVLLANTKDALIATLGSDAKPLIESRYQSLLSDIDELFASLSEQLKPLAGTTVFVYHNSFGYFLDAFSIKQEAVETGGKEPTAKALAALIEKAKAERPKVIFVQKQFPVASAKTVADAVGAVVVSLDPLAYNWMESIKTMADALMMVR